MKATANARLLLAAMALLGAAGTCPAQVAFLEHFNFPGGNHAFGEVGWTEVGNDGVRRTDTNGRITGDGDIEGSHRAWIGNAYNWFVTDAPVLTSITRVRWLDRNAGINYRLGLEVAGTWYLSDQLATSAGGGFDPGDGAHPGLTITDFSSGFAPWGAGDATTGAPANDTEAWDLSTLGAPGALPAGDITRVGLMNISGSARFDYFEVSGTAVPDTEAPVITARDPPNGAVTVTVGTDFVMHFDEDVQKGTGNMRIREFAGDAVVSTVAVASASVSIVYQRVTVDPPDNLDYETRYYVELDAGAIEDLSANDHGGIAGNGTWNFTTVGPPLYIEDLNFPDASSHAFGELDWTMVRADGTRVTDNASRIIHSSSMEGSHRVYDESGEIWWVTDAPSLGSIEMVRWLDTGGTYRLGLEVDGTWYLSSQVATSTGGGFDPGDGAHSGVTIKDFSSGFAPWGAGDAVTGAPADDTEPWDLTTLGASGALPNGRITRIGVMRLGGSVRFDYFELTGSLHVPPPPGTVIFVR